MTSSRGHRFRKTNRLPDAAAFGRVFERPSRSRDKLFTVLCRSKENGPARLGLAISKKHCRKATQRNRIKRLVRESFRTHQGDLDGLDVVVINQAATAMAAGEDVVSSLERHWKRCAMAAGRQKDAEQ